MSVAELLATLPSNTYVRVRAIPRDNDSVVTVAGCTGVRRTKQLLVDMRARGIDNAHVMSICPLWHAQELYVGCVEC